VQPEYATNVTDPKSKTPASDRGEGENRVLETPAAEVAAGAFRLELVPEHLVVDVVVELHF
jgi:hypothetical protein